MPTFKPDQGEMRVYEPPATGARAFDVEPLHAVVMAAGEGRRLRPITERWPKPVLPIDGKPVVVTLVHDLAAPAASGSSS